jgi:tape measure domain-containing protein
VAENIQITIEAVDKTSPVLAQISSGVGQLNNSVSGLTRGFDSLASAASAVGLALGGREIFNYVNTIETLDNKLRLVTNSSADLANKYKELNNLANETRQGIAPTIDLYSKLAIGTKDTGLAHNDLITIIDAFNKSLVVSGAGTQAAAAATYQFGQAMGSGRLQGDELRSMMENNAKFMDVLKTTTGLTTAELRKLASDGMLSTKIVAQALKDGLGDLNDEFGKMPKTVGQAFTSLQNELQSTVRDFLNSSQASSYLIDAMEALKRNIVPVTIALGALATALAIGAIIQVVTFAFGGLAAAAGVATGAITALGTAMTFLAKTPLGRVVALLGIAAGTVYEFTKETKAAETPVNKLGQTTEDLNTAVKTNNQVTPEMNKLLQESGILAKLNETAFSKYLDEIKQQIKYGALFSDDRKNMIDIDKALQKTVEDGRKINKTYTEAELENMRQRGVAALAQRDLVLKTTQELEDRYKGYISFIKGNQDKALSDQQQFDEKVKQFTTDRLNYTTAQEEKTAAYLDALRADYSERYKKLIESTNLANLTNTDKYLKEVSQLEDDIANNRISKDLDVAATRTAISKKYNEEYVALAKKGNESILTDTQNYLNKVTEIENAYRIGIITSEEQKNQAITGARAQYGKTWDDMAKQSRDQNVTAEQEYLRKMQEFNAASSAGLIKNKEDESAILKRIRDDYVNTTVSSYSTLYGMLETKLQDMLGISGQKWKLMTEVTKLFGIDTNAIIKDTFASAIGYLIGFTNPGGQNITTLGGVVASIFGGSGKARTDISSFASASSSVFSSFGSTAANIFSGLGSSITNVFKGLYNFLSNNVLDVLGDIVSSAATAVSSLLKVGSSGGGGGGGGSWVDDVISIGSAIWSFFSDARMKENVMYNQTLSNGINLYDFNYKNKYKLGTDTKTGVLAQEVQGKYPNAVNESSSGMLMVDYSKLPIPKGLLKLAKGGILGAPTLLGGGTAIGGEAGPEAVLPLDRGPDGKLGVASTGGSNGPININFTINAVDSKGIDTLLIEKKSLITNIVRGAIQQRGVMI